MVNNRFRFTFHQSKVTHLEVQQRDKQRSDGLRDLLASCHRLISLSLENGMLTRGIMHQIVVIDLETLRLCEVYTSDRVGSSFDRMLAQISSLRSLSVWLLNLNANKNIGWTFLRSLFEVLHQFVELETLELTLQRSELIDNILELDNLRLLTLNLKFSLSVVDFNRLCGMLRRLRPMFVLIHVRKLIRCDRILYERWMLRWESRRLDLLNLDRNNLVLDFDFE